LRNAPSPCGLLLTTGVGQQIILCAEASLTLNVVLFVTKHQRRLIISLLDAPMQGNFGFDSSHKLAYKLSPPSLQILLFMTGGKRSAVTGVACCYMVITLLYFLGPGLFGHNEIGAFLMESSLTWHEFLLCPVRKESYGR
jgi:hypothetical protein